MHGQPGRPQARHRTIRANAAWSRNRHAFQQLPQTPLEKRQGEFFADAACGVLPHPPQHFRFAHEALEPSGVIPGLSFGIAPRNKEAAVGRDQFCVTADIGCDYGHSARHRLVENQCDTFAGRWQENISEAWNNSRNAASSCQPSIRTRPAKPWRRRSFRSSLPARHRPVPTRRNHYHGAPTRQGWRQTAPVASARRAAPHRRSLRTAELFPGAPGPSRASGCWVSTSPHRRTSATPRPCSPRRHGRAASGAGARIRPSACPARQCIERLYPDGRHRPSPPPYD